VRPFPLNKSNSLKSTSEIDLVFKDGSKLSSKLISLYYVKSDKENSLRIAFSVGKKTHALATTRNKLKRLMKEALRVNGHEILSQNLPYNLVFIYFSSKEESFKSIEESMKSLLLSFKNKSCLE
jgi:ribonuclease P protein component